MVQTIKEDQCLSLSRGQGMKSLRSEHATHLIIQSHGSEFTLLFFELQPPFTIGTPEEQAAQMEQLPNVEAKCVRQNCDECAQCCTSVRCSCRAIGAIQIGSARSYERG